MPRLIDADALIQDFDRRGWDGVQTVVDMMPTIDAVPVVRCAKCIHYEMGVCLKIYSDGAVSKYAWQERKPDDFCSYGARKGGEG